MHEFSEQLLNVAIVSLWDCKPLISMETMGTGPGPICFLLRELRRYFITVIMIYFMSIWTHSDICVRPRWVGL